MSGPVHIGLADRAVYRLGLFDVREALPGGWAQELLHVARDGHVVDLPGMDVGTGSSMQRPLKYRVTTGAAIRDRLGWLWQLYSEPFRHLASSIYGQTLDIARDIESAVNMNYMVGPRDSYEWHRDTNAVTGLLFVTSHSVSGGGALVFDDQRVGLRTTLTPKAGWLAAFDARQILHTVEPLVSAHEERVTVPMNYYAPGDLQVRPDGLDEHVYGDGRA
jgi:hypothetical protein